MGIDEKTICLIIFFRVVARSLAILMASLQAKMKAILNQRYYKRKICCANKYYAKMPGIMKSHMAYQPLLLW
ncbi:MAG: hypothetical protein WHT65_07125 [Pseudothermotoga sp.]